MRCRQQGKPVIVASHLLQSMIEYPTPTRAEVADISDVVRQRADALMLSGESAAGAYPGKAVDVLRAVSMRIEDWCRSAAPFGPLSYTKTCFACLHLVAARPWSCFRLTPCTFSGSAPSTCGVIQYPATCWYNLSVAIRTSLYSHTKVDLLGRAHAGNGE